MIYLILATISSALVSVMMRLSESRMKNNISTLAVNYAVCVLLAGFYTGVPEVFPGKTGMGVAAGLGALNGFLYLSAFILMQISVRRNGVVLSTVFMKLGVLVPAATAIIFFGEMPEAVQVCGFAVAVTAIILIHLEKDQTDVTFKSGLVLLLAVGGSGDAMAKVYEELGSAESEEYFCSVHL